MRDLFPGYYRPTDEDFKRLWNEAIFTFDANLLLHIYRFTDETRGRLFNILELLQDRLWIGHQAAQEFQKNRLAAISDGTKLYSELRAAMAGLDTVLQKHRIHPYLQEVRGVVSPSVASLSKGLETLEARHPDLLQDDPLRERLSSLLVSHVGLPYDPDALKKHLAQAKARAEAGIAPGFVDYRQKKDRPEDERCGDVLLWFQIMEHATAQKKPVILVTDDKKDDWWLKHEGQTVGPQPSLVGEMAQGPGVAFYMYTSERFLKEAAKFLGLQELPRSVSEARSVREELHDYAMAMATPEQRRMFNIARAMGEQSTCVSNLKQCGLATMQYAADYGHFPNASTWCDDLMPYFEMSPPELKMGSCPSSPLPWGYAMNASLSRTRRDEIERPWECVLFFDSSAEEFNAHGGEEILCSPACHVEGNNICFVDGHVETVDPLRGKLLRWDAKGAG